MKHIPLTITEEQRDNFLLVADYLIGGEHVMGFGMEAYLSPCKTVGCVIGHAASIGIGTSDLKACNFNYDLYAHKAFGASLLCFVENPLYDFVFAYQWYCRDNSSAGAAKRIYYALEHGVPENHRKQRCGIDTLCYLDQPVHAVEKVPVRSLLCDLKSLSP